MKKFEGSIAYLTPEQVSLMADVKQEWLDKALFSTRQPKVAEVKEGVWWLYSLSGLEAPTVIVTDSPLSAQYAANILNNDQEGEQIQDPLYRQIYNQVSEQVSEQVSNQVYNQVYRQVYRQIYNQVSEQVRNQVREQVRNQVREQVYRQIYNQVSEQVYRQVSEQRMEHCPWLGWGLGGTSGRLAFCDYFRRIGVVKHEGFDRFTELLSQGVWDMVCLKGYAIVCSPPVKLHFGTQYQDVAEVEWGDGCRHRFGDNATGDDKERFEL